VMFPEIARIDSLENRLGEAKAASTP
jgi:hypothetical protein